MKTIAIIALTVAAACWAATIYWSPYQSCVRSQMNDPRPETEAEANLTCARWIKAN